ncbi:hypothetical protein Tsubulata_012263 [Turnera subulata]|uniref:Uncharacterized protein n=1 Tax=Turnera subulata TaxID=218843 RepID=A0A9Q0FVQ6_9ROSI|nr:hypothetical protein Tsubulata_012263 [Turnera subulata]
MDKELIINDEDMHDGGETRSTDEIENDDPSSNEGSNDKDVQVGEPKVGFCVFKRMGRQLTISYSYFATYLNSYARAADNQKMHKLADKYFLYHKDFTVYYSYKEPSFVNGS